MKRYTILSLFCLTFVLPAFAFQDPKYPNLEFTVLDAKAKTVSVKAEDPAYYTKDSILNIPAFVTNSGDPYTVTTIAANGFKAIKIKKIILPSTIIKIESTALRSIDTPFSINLNEGLKEIGGRAFTGSKLQNELLIPSTITKIGSAAFYNTPVKTVIMQTYDAPTLAATSSDITSKYYIFPATATIVVPEKSYFVYCSANHWKTWKITDPYIHINNNIKYSIISDTSASVLGFNTKPSEVVDLVIPETISFNDCSGVLRTLSITQTNDNCFKGINLLSSIVFPSSMRIIGYQSFRDNSTIRSIKLNEGLQEIGNRAFCNDVNIEDTITISQTVTKIGPAAFYNCGKISAFRIQNETPPDVKTTDKLPFERCNAVFLVPCGYGISYLSDTYWGTLNISDPCSEFKVNGLYYSLAGEKKVKLIGHEKTKALPDTFNIPTEVAYNTKTYTIVNIGANTFENDTNIVFVALPSHCSTIGKSAFKNCKKLQKLVLNEGLETIEDSSFFYTIIDTLRTPTTLKTIGKCSFRNNTNLRGLFLNEGLQSIGERAFTNNSALIDTIIIPSSITHIGAAVFTGCNELTHVILRGSIPPQVTSDGYPVFGTASTKFIVPCGSTEEYKTADYWKDLSSNITNNCEPLILKQGESLERETAVSSIAFSRTFPMNLWQELYLPFNVDSVLVLDEGEYFDINVPFDSTKNAGYFYLYGLKNIDTDAITFQEVHKLEGFKPYLILFIDKYNGYFAGKEIVFKTKLGEYTLTDNYSAPNLTSSYQLHGNKSLWEHSLADGFTLSSSYENGQYKFHFDYNENAPIHPFSWVVTPTKDIASKIMPAPRFLAGRWGNQSSGGEVTTSIQNTSNNSLTYTQSGSLLTLHTQGQPCKVYAVDGTLLLSTDAAQDEVTIELNKGLYIVYSNGTSHKILF